MVYIIQALDIPEHMQTPLKIMRKGCLARTGVEEKYVDQSKNGNLPDVPGLRCYVLCMMEHAGVIDENGTVTFSNIFHLFTPSVKESFQTATEQCSTICNCEIRSNGLSKFSVIFEYIFRWWIKMWYSLSHVQMYGWIDSRGKRNPFDWIIFGGRRFTYNIRRALSCHELSERCWILS